ncbi:MAG: Nudix family hydrolase [Pseudomarimonas sp.]
MPAASPVPTNCAPTPSPQPPAPLHSKPTHVVAAVLRDAQGRVLLSQRIAKADLAGLWEFPGGKRERGEDSPTALRRELREELGIAVQEVQPLIEVPHAYPQKRIVLEVFAAEWSGEPVGCEGQALRWLSPGLLANMPMPSADQPVVAALTQPDRYLITPEPSDKNDVFMRALTVALATGITRLQLRAPGLARDAMWALAESVLGQCQQAGAECLINSACMDARQIAAHFGCGLHLTTAHLMQAAIRPLPAESLVAASCHDPRELAHAQALGCDFVVLGPVAVTLSHPGAAAMGWPAFRAMRERVALPIYALGGMQIADLAIARSHGAQGIAAIRGLWPTG